MNIHFSVCNKCKTFDYKELIKVLLEKYPSATFDLKCQSFCGPGSIRPFVAINENFIVADTVEGLLENIENFLEDNNVR